MIKKKKDDSYYIHINRGTIDSNRKHGTKKPAVRIQKGKYGKSEYCYKAKFAEGEVVYSPHKPILPCGARLVIRTKEKPKVIR